MTNEVGRDRAQHGPYLPPEDQEQQLITWPGCRPCGVSPPLIETALVSPPAPRQGDVQIRRDGELEIHRDGEIRSDAPAGQAPEAGPPFEDPVSHLGRFAAACCTELHGWAGAHRHGAVRPRPRTNRRERPPRRWC